MQEGEDLARFIEEQRAKIAYDRDRLKNNPPSSITDNTVNRQILSLDKENRVPDEGRTVLPARRSENRNPLPIQTTTRPPSTPRILKLGDDYKRKQEKLKEELRADYRNAMAEKTFRTTGRRVDNPEIPLGARTNSDLGLSLPIKERLTAKVKGAATETYEELLERKRKQEKSYRGINDDDDDIRERGRHRGSDREEDDGYYSQRRVRFPSKGRRSHGRGSRSRRDEDILDDDDFDNYAYRPRRGRRRGRPTRRGRRYSSEDEDSEYDSEEDRRPRRRRDASFERRRPAPSFDREATTGSLRETKPKVTKDDLRSKSAPPEQDQFTGLPIGHVPSANTVQRRKEEYRVQLLQQMEENKQQKQKERDLDKKAGLTFVGSQGNKNNNNAGGKDSSPPKRHAAASPPSEDIEPQKLKRGKKKATRKVKLDLSSDDDEEPRRSFYRGPAPRQPYFGPPLQPPQMGYYPPQLGNPYEDPYYYYGTRNPLDPAAAAMLPLPQAGVYPGVSPVMAAAYATGRAEHSKSPDRERRGPGQSTARHSYKNESSLIADEQRDKEKKKQQTVEYQEELKHQIALKEKRKKEARDEQERYDQKMEDEARNYNPWGKGGGGAPMKDRQGNLISDLRQMHLENEEAGRDPNKAQEVVRERLPQTNLYRREERPVIDLSPREGPGDDVISPRFGRSNPFEAKQSDEQKAQRDVYKEYLQKQIEEKRQLEAEKKERERFEEEKEERRLEEQRKKIQAELDAEVEKEKKKKEVAERQNEEIRIQAEERRKEDQRKRMEEEDEQRRRKEQELDEKLRSMTKSPPIPTLRNQPNQSDESPYHPQARDPPHTQEDRRVHTLPPQRQPVVHTARVQTYRAESPPREHERRPPIQSRNESKRISRELSALRKQLLSEQRRVEDQLRTVDLSQPPARKINSEFLVDLSKARQKPVSVRRPPTVEKDRPSSRALREFTDYKYRPDDTASIRMFKAEYPETPDDSKALERQQLALLSRQDRNLNDLRNQAKSEPIPGRRRAKEQPRRGLIPPSVAQSKASLLEAETTYVPIVPDDDDELDNGYRFESNESSVPPSRQSSRRPSARERRRWAKKPPSAHSERIVPPRSRPDNYSLNSLTSLATLDVDRLANKNQHRLDKLKAIQGDEVSLTDPDDILDRFVNKQTKNRRPPTNDDGVGGRAGPSGYRDPDQVIATFSNRPPSVNTVDTEPWLRPETGPTVA